MRTTLALASVALLISACTGPGDSHDKASPDAASRSDPGPVHITSSRPAPTVPLVPSPMPRHCEAKPTPAPGVGVQDELSGAANEGRLYALLFSSYPLRADTESKIAWRLEGSGAVRFEAFGPAGRRLEPVWGPEEHVASNWHRPGTEWGTGFRFDAAGCWIVQARRGDVAGVVLLNVA